VRRWLHNVLAGRGVRDVAARIRSSIQALAAIGVVDIVTTPPALESQASGGDTADAGADGQAPPLPSGAAASSGDKEAPGVAAKATTKARGRRGRPVLAFMKKPWVDIQSDAAAVEHLRSIGLGADPFE